jgi:hypothetical protein
MPRSREFSWEGAVYRAVDNGCYYELHRRGTVVEGPLGPGYEGDWVEVSGDWAPGLQAAYDEACARLDADPVGDPRTMYVPVSPAELALLVRALGDYGDSGAADDEGEGEELDRLHSRLVALLPREGG